MAKQYKYDNFSSKYKKTYAPFKFFLKFLHKHTIHIYLSSM